MQVWEGHDVVVQARRITGETDPLKSTPGSIRGDYAIELARSVTQCSIHWYHAYTVSLGFVSSKMRNVQY